MIPIPPPTRLFESVEDDHLGPFKVTERGNSFILVMTDYLTKWLVAIAVPDTSSLGVMTAITEAIVPTHDAVDRIISDQGAAFTSVSRRGATDRWL